MWIWNARLQLRALTLGLRYLLLVPPAPVDQDREDGSSNEACPPVSGEAAATVERVAADIEAYLSQVKPNRWSLIDV